MPVPIGVGNRNNHRTPLPNPNSVILLTCLRKDAIKLISFGFSHLYTQLKPTGQFSARLSSAYRLVQGMQCVSPTYRLVSSTYRGK